MGVGITILPILQMKKMRLREGRTLGWGHTSVKLHICKWYSRGWNQAVWLQN